VKIGVKKRSFLSKKETWKVRLSYSKSPQNNWSGEWARKGGRNGKKEGARQRDRGVSPGELDLLVEALLKQLQGCCHKL